MIQISSDVLELLKGIDYGIPEVDVRDVYLTDDPHLPMIAVDELPGNDGVYLDNHPSIVTNIFTIECYATQMMVDGSPQTGKAVAYRLMDLADRELTGKLGLTMQGTITAAPYSDQRVFRAVARYVAYIDTRNGTILRLI